MTVTKMTSATGQNGQLGWIKAYEGITISNLAVLLANHDHVEDFELSTDDNSYGDFDDIVVSIRQKGRDWITCAIQLKLADNRESIENMAFSAPRLAINNKFSIEKQFESYKNCSSVKDINFIIFTNHTMDKEIDGTLGTKNHVKFQIKRRVENPDFINLHDISEDIYEVVVDPSSLDDQNLLSEKQKEEMQEFQSFCQKLFILPNQPTCEDVIAKATTKDNGIVHRIYQEFVVEWMKLPKKRFLNRELLRTIMCELNLRPCTSPEQICTNTTTGDPIFSRILEEFDVILAEKLTKKLIEMFTPKFDLSDPILSEKIKEVCKKYFIPEEETIPILWHLKRIPLIIRVDENNQQMVSDAINLCPKGKRKFLLIAPDQSFLQCNPQLKIFHNLSDCLDIFKIPTFGALKVSLQGRQTVPLKDVLDNVDMADLITIDHLLKMYEEPLVIGNAEVLPKPYIEQRLEKNVIDTERFIEKTGDIIVVNCNGNADILKEKCDGSFLYDMEDYFGRGSTIKRQNMSKRKVIYVDDSCSQPQFDDITEKLRGKTCHWFNLTSSGSLDWIKSTNKSGYEEIKKHATHVEFNFCARQIPQNVFNLICADTGMGKSKLTKIIKNHDNLKEYWVLRLNCRDHQQFFKTQSCNLDDLIFLHNRDQKSNTFETNVIKAFFKSKKIVFIWDGLDELPSDLIDRAISKFEEINLQGYIQWITSRPHLKEQLENTFHVFAWNICEFSHSEQESYIRESLCSVTSDEDQLESIVQKINKIVTAQTRRLFGIPLQIYLLTELFRSNVGKYVDVLESEFTIVKMFEWFIEERFRPFIQNGSDISNPRLNKLLEDFAAYILKDYELAAMATFKHIDLQDRDREDYELFLSKLKKDGGDVYQIIIQANDDDVTFIHEAFREYFIASWISKNFKRLKTLEVFLFQDQNENIRLLFDMIMAEHCPLHLAVLNQNIEQIQDNYASEYKKTDKCGRNALHLASSWGVGHPILLKKKGEHMILIDSSRVANSINNMTQGIKKSNDIMDVLLTIVDPSAKDDLFNFTSIDYADATLCLNALDIFLSKEPNLDVIRNFKVFDAGSIAYYSIRMNYTNLFRGLMRVKIPYIKDSAYKNNLLHLAAKFANTETKFISALMETTLRFKLEARIRPRNYYINGRNLNNLTPLHIAASEGHFKMNVILVERGANINVKDKDGWTPLHYASDKGHLDIVQFLVGKGADVNAKNSSGWTPLHSASEKGHSKTVRFLVEKRAAVDVKYKCGLTPLHYASDKGHLEIVEFLVEKGANINAKNLSGWTPLHSATEKIHMDVVQFLVEKGAEVNVKYDCDLNPLHYAAEKGHLGIVQFLVEKGADVNAKSSLSSTPLHYASEKGHLNVVQFLVEKRADINLKNSSGSTPLICASKKGHSNIVQVLVDEEWADVNSKNSSGSTLSDCASENQHFNTSAQSPKENSDDLDTKKHHNSTPSVFSSQQVRSDSRSRKLSQSDTCVYDYNRK